MDDYRIAILGGGDVGKSSLIFQLVQEEFYHEKFDITNDDIHRKRILVDGEHAILEVQEVASTEHGPHALLHSYLRGVQGVMIVYSSTSRTSFCEAQQLKEFLCVEGSEHFTIVLIESKIDLEDQREVPVSDGTALAQAWNLPLLQTSARLGTNIKEAFSELTRRIRADHLNRPPTVQRTSGGKSLAKCFIL